MAAADTARLIAALELQDKFSGPLRGADKALGGFERRMGTATRATKGLGVAGVAVGTALGTLGARLIGAGISGIVGGISAGVASLNELENVTVATNTVLASTKGISGQTAQGIRDLSEEYENLNATMDDKVIQSGANMLLTFTNIREEAFEPALAAALDMNEAMGGGPEGLQTTIIQIGKALNDPIKGVTALKKVGVTLTDQQREQIKVLVESNDLYGAQQIILKELGVEFGGRFAAAGKTAEGQQARLRDRIEDVQKALAGPLIPALDKAREKLIGLLGSPIVLQGAERLGAALAGLFTEERLEKGVGLVEKAITMLTTGDFSGATAGLSSVVSSVAGLPWASIGDAAKLLGTGAKAMLDAFLGLPPWVQTAVLTGWGLNKLTGGALGGIVGELGKGLIKGILNMNAAVVNVNGKVVNGGGSGGGPGGKRGKGPGGFLSPGVLGAVGVALSLTASNDPNAQRSQDLINVTKGLMTQAEFNRLWGHGLDVNITGGVGQFNPANRGGTRGPLGTGTSSAAAPWSTEHKAAFARLNAGVDTLPDTAMLAPAVTALTTNLPRLPSILGQVDSKAQRQISLLGEDLAATRGQTGVLTAIRNKRSSVSVTTNVTANVTVSATSISQSITSTQRSINAGGAFAE